MKETTMNKEDQPEFVGFNFMGDIIEHFLGGTVNLIQAPEVKDTKKAYQCAISNGFSVKQAAEIVEEIQKKTK